MNQKVLRSILSVLIYATFIVPLIVVPSSFIFPFIVPKVVTFRLLVGLITATYILVVVAERQKIAWYRSPLIIAVSLFLLSFAFSTVVGVDPYHSFWDNHERMLGLFTIIHYGLYFFVLTSVYKKWADWQWMMRAFLLAGSIAMIVGIMQVFNPYYLLNGGSSRVASTLGNSIYVGGYGLFLCFTAGLLLVREKKIFWQILEVVAFFLALAGLMFSGSRGALLGMIVGVGIVIIGYVLLLKQAPKIRLTLGIILAVSVLSGLFLYSSRHAQWVADIPALERTLNSGIEDTVNSARWIAWQIGFESWQERPIFGWGPNNFFYAFNKYYHPNSLEFGYGETWFDNAHNVIMNTLAVQGLVGLVTYLGIFVTAWVCVYRGYKRGTTNLHVAIFGTAFLAAHLTQSVTVFENPTSYLYFMFWLAMVNALTVGEATVAVKDAQSKPAVVSGKVSGTLALGTWAVGILFVIIFDIQPARANMAALTALQVAGNGSDDSITLVEQVLQSHSPHIDDIRSDISRSLVSSVEGNYTQLGVDRSNRMLGLARNALKANIEMHPLDIRNTLMLAQLEQIAARINNSGMYLGDAQSALLNALQYSPKRQQILYALAWVKAQLGDIKSAVDYIQQALDEDPKIGESYWRLMYIYKAVGDEAHVQALWQKAKIENVQFTDQELSTINSLLTTPAATTTAATKTKTVKPAH